MGEWRVDHGRQRLVRHGHLPEREIMIGIGPVAVSARACVIGLVKAPSAFAFRRRLCRPPAARLRPYLFNRLPEAERAIGDCEFGAHRQPMPLQIEQHLPPRLRALAHAIDEATSSFLPSGVAPMMTSRHGAASSSLACTWMPSTQK